MFTDIVDATARAAALGDGRWRDLLAPARRDRAHASSRAIEGREVKTVGDGFLAAFDGPPSRALRCALAITRAARELGVEVRVGMHTGECELIGDDVGGMAVHIASRVERARRRRRGARLGHRLRHGRRRRPRFADRGGHELKGVPGAGRCSPSSVRMSPRVDRAMARRRRAGGEERRGDDPARLRGVDHVVELEELARR